jgi:preprotein translocase subunit SecD
MQFRPVLLASSGATASVGADGKSTNPPVASGTPTPGNHSDLNQISAEVQQAYDATVCSADFVPQTFKKIDLVVTCNRDNTEKYILGPVDVPGTEIEDASAGTESTSTGLSTGKWLVSLNFKSAGAAQFTASTTRLFGLTDPQNRFAVTLDGLVVTAPTVQGVIPGGNAQITGNFSQTEATKLANQLKYGSLPIQFEIKSTEKVSATLGIASLQSGIVAGLIGLILVVIYSMFQYRALAIVTIGSLAIAGVLTYLAISYLSWRQGYRLSLSGVAGLIVAIGITADSFIVYFERVRDELRDGRALGAAVEAGWKRALRTIIVSDGVSLLAAGTLYVLTVGNVRGFAFTLGLTTLIDLLVVILFTHPVLQLMSGLRFFSSGHKFSGFDTKLVTGSYTGRGTFREPRAVVRDKKATKEVNRRQTIAERKSQEGTK